jgi:hypothetical protein
MSREELVSYKLRTLYSRYGYSQYKMSKFEEYELYVRNKNFLVSDNVITFTDHLGRLLALKPDVTLSIVKSGRDVPGKVSRIYYNENVYRTAPGQTTGKAPGTVLSAGKKGIEVACGNGESLFITELQAEGGKRMAAAAYLLGHPIEV